MNKKGFKKLEEMNLLDDFLFGSMVAYPEIGKRFVKILLRTIFGREFRQLSVTAQKVYYGADRDLHGARLDVYLEPEENSGERVTVYDIEPDLKDRNSDIRALPRRMRFYHGKIAARSLDSGTDYDKLKNVVIIMIVPYDPFGLNRMIYTVKNKCVEVPDMEYEDGASTLFLYTKGTEGIPNEAIKQLLRYMENTTYENAVNEDLREMHRMVETVKRDPEVDGMRIQLVEDVIMLSEEKNSLTEEKIKLTEENAKLAEKNVKITEENARMAEENVKITEENARMAEENVKITEENARMAEENVKITEENARIAEENVKITEENARMAEELIKLREELARRDAVEKQTAND